MNHFLENEPSPGIDYERKLVQALLPGITAADVTAAAKELFASPSRVILATSPQKQGLVVPTEAELRAAVASAEKVEVTAWKDTASTAALMARDPEPAAIKDRRELPELGVTVVRFANGVEAWFKPTDFKNDEVLFSLVSQGGSSLAPPEQFIEASLAPAQVQLSGIGRAHRRRSAAAARRQDRLGLADHVVVDARHLGAQQSGQPRNRAAAPLSRVHRAGRRRRRVCADQEEPRGGVPESRARSRRALRREGRPR